MLILKIGQRRDIYKSLEELRKIHRCNDILFFNDFAIRASFAEYYTSCTSTSRTVFSISILLKGLRSKAAAPEDRV